MKKHYCKLISLSTFFLPIVILLIEIRFLNFSILEFCTYFYSNDYLLINYPIIISVGLIIALLFSYFVFFIKYRFKYFLFFVTAHFLYFYWCNLLSEILYFLMNFNRVDDNDRIDVGLISWLLALVCIFITGIIADKRINKNIV